MHLKPTRKNVNLLQKWIDNGGVFNHWWNRFTPEDNLKFFLRDNKIHYIMYVEGEEFGTWIIEPTDDVWLERGKTMSDDVYEMYMKKEDKNKETGK